LSQKIIGHERVLERLKPLSKAGNGTFLFYGPPSIGKRTVAFEIAKELLCLGNCTEDKPCQSCSRPEHPDFLCIGRYSKIKVEDVDNLILFTTTLPFISKVKVVVIDNVENITVEAANRLLKTLEEPPQRFIFFLVSSNPGTILPTIL
jgi:DNA polymerase III subunit delta'